MKVAFYAFALAAGAASAWTGFYSESRFMRLVAFVGTTSGAFGFGMMLADQAAAR